MALLPPLAKYVRTQGFGRSMIAAEPSMWYVGSTSAKFVQYPGASFADNVHPAIDMAAPLGTAIVASEIGVVVFAGWAPNPGPEAGGGLIVEIAIAGGMHYLSAHCSVLKVKATQKVSRGQIIAFVGESGAATGPHDHFQCFTVDGYGHRIFWNPDLFLPGGAWANDSRIKPPSVASYVVVTGAGVNIRTGPGTNYPIYRTSSSTYLIGVKMKFGGWVSGGSYTINGVSSNVWAKVYLNAGWRYIAKPLVKFVA
jgi:hypothetical protein